MYRGLTAISPQVTLPARPIGNVETHALYMALFDERDDLLSSIKEHGVEATNHYLIPLHLQDAASSLGYKSGDFPVNKFQASHSITLSVHQFLEDQHLEFMPDEIREF